MNFFIYLLFSFIAVCLLAIWYINIYNDYQNLIIRINESEANIDSVLRKRFDLLNKSINIIKANCNIEGEILEMIVKLRSRKLSNFDLDRQLYDALNEFHSIKENYKELKNTEAFMKIDIALNESEAEIVAFRKYYNDIITDYNKLARVFPSNLVAKTCKYKARPYFDGKNMNDDDNKDFKL